MLLGLLVRGRERVQSNPFHRNSDPKRLNITSLKDCLVIIKIGAQRGIVDKMT